MLSLALRQAAYPADAALGSLLDYVARLQAALGTPMWDLAASELASGRVPAAVSLQAQPAPATEAHAAAAGRGGGGGRPQGRPRKDAALSAPFAPPSSPAAARAAGAERATHVTQTLLSRVYGSPPAEDAAEEPAAAGAAADAMAMFTQEPEAYDASQPGAFRQAQAGAGPGGEPAPAAAAAAQSPLRAAAAARLGGALKVAVRLLQGAGPADPLEVRGRGEGEWTPRLRSSAPRRPRPPHRTLLLRRLGRGVRRSGRRLKPAAAAARSRCLRRLQQCGGRTTDWSGRTWMAFPRSLQTPERAQRTRVMPSRPAAAAQRPATGIVRGGARMRNGSSHAAWSGTGWASGKLFWPMGRACSMPTAPMWTSRQERARRARHPPARESCPTTAAAGQMAQSAESAD